MYKFQYLYFDRSP